MNASIKEKVADLVATFKSTGRIVIVGASLAGLRAAEALRKEGFTGKLTIIGDEPDEPYDRPPLSKQVLKGWVPADHTKLPRVRQVDAEWRLGIAAIGLDRRHKQVRLANGEQVPFDRLLIATGTRAREWPNKKEAGLEGVYTIRTSNDAARLQKALAAKPGRVLVTGAGFVGSEVASVCRETGPRCDGRGTRLCAASGRARRRDWCDRRGDAARPWRRPPHRDWGEVPRWGRQRPCAACPVLRR